MPRHWPRRWRGRCASCWPMARWRRSSAAMASLISRRSEEKRMGSVRLSGVLLCCVTSLLQAAPPAYVSEEKSASLGVIDLERGERLGALPAGPRPRGLAAAHGRVYVSDGKLGAVLEIDPATRHIVRQQAVG